MMQLYYNTLIRVDSDTSGVIVLRDGNTTIYEGCGATRCTPDKPNIRIWTAEGCMRKSIRAIHILLEQCPLQCQLYAGAKRWRSLPQRVIIQLLSAVAAIMYSHVDSCCQGLHRNKSHSFKHTHVRTTWLQHSPTNTNSSRKCPARLPLETSAQCR